MNKYRDDISGIAKLPPELTERLRSMIRRVRRIVWLRGLLATGAVMLGCALAIMAVDAAVLIFSPAVRWGLSGLGLAATLATAWSSLVRPLSQRLTLTRMARVLETRHPELQERISSAIELLSMGGDAASRGSAQLIALLAQDAQADMRAVQPRQEFTGRSVKPALVAAAVVAVLFGLLLAAWPRQTVLLFKRAVAPYEDFASLQGAGLLVEPGDVVRLQGEELNIRVRVKGGGAGRAELRCKHASGEETVERMRRTSAADAVDGVHDLTFPSVTESFQYRARYGAGLSRYYSVTVLPPPAATRLTVTCLYPSYTKQAGRTLPENVRDIVGVAGTRVQIDADFNRRAEGMLFVGDRRFPGLPKKTPGASWNLTLATNMADRWSVALCDDYGFTGRVESASLKVISDRPPVVTTLSPHTDKLTLPPYGQVTFAFTVNEDFGLARSELVTSAAASGDRVEPFALQTDGKETWTGTHELDLARMQLGGVRQFKVWLRVFDTLPPELGGPQRGESRPVSITLDVNAKRIEDQLREEQKKTLQEMLKAAAERLNQSSSQVNGIQTQVAEDPLKPAVMQVLTRSQERAATAVDLVKRAADLCDKTYFATLTPRIRDVANDTVEPARARTAEILFTDLGKRQEKAGEAVKELAAAAVKVGELVTAIDELDKKLAEISKTAELAQREKALAEQAAEKKMTPAELEAWKKEQEKIAKELAAQAAADTNAVRNALEKMEEAKADMNKEQPTARDEQEQMAARKAEEAAEKALDAAEKASEAAENAEEFARDRKAAEAIEKAANLTEEAAKQAEKAAMDAKDAAQKQQAGEKAEDARDRRDAAQQAQDAAAKAEQAAAKAEEAAKKAEAAAQAQEQGQAAEAGKQAEASKKDAQAANQQADQAQKDAQKAADQAKQENAEKIGQAAEMAKEAAEMADRAADLAQEADGQALKAENLPNEQKQAQTQQAADKARQAQEMAREAGEKAREAGQKAAEEQAAAQQAEQAAAREAGTPEQIQAAARQAEQEARQAAKQAQEAAAAAKQAVDQAAKTQDPVMQEAAKEGAEAAQMAEQAANLAEQAGERVEKTEGQNLPDDKEAAENRRATEEAEAAAQLAREAAQKARNSAKMAQEEQAENAQEAKQGAKEAAAEAAEAAREAGEAAKTAKAAGSEKAEEAAKLAGKAGELAKEAGEQVTEAMQNAEKGNEQGDQQATAQAEQAEAKAEQAAAMAKQASAQAKSAEQASENAKEAGQHAEEASQKMSEMADQQAAKQGQNMKPPTQWRTEAAKSMDEQQNRNDTMNLGERSFMPMLLKNAGFPESEWARFKGKTESEVMEEITKNVSPEYRELVRRYFVELSREGGKSVEGLK
jgi:hypothetical protein